MNIAVIGLGRFGSNLARTLTELGHDVLAIDISERAVQGIADTVTQAITADATDETVLEDLGIHEYEIVFVSLGDIESSILIKSSLAV